MDGSAKASTRALLRKKKGSRKQEQETIAAPPTRGAGLPAPARVGQAVGPGDILLELPATGQVRVGAGIQPSGEGDTLVASRAGVLKQTKAGKVWIEGRLKRYIPAVDDAVVGIIRERYGESWTVDIHGPFNATLPALAFEGVTRRNRPRLEAGDVVYAKVTNAPRDGDTELTCVLATGKSGGFGALTGAKRLRLFASSTPSPARSRSASPTRELLRSLVQQARKETLPWLRDLIDPITSGPPELLTDTVSPRSLADPDSCFADVDGVTLHYKDTGVVQDSERPAVLLLHGFNGCVFSWRNCMQPLSEAGGKGGVRVLAVDRPPFGLSDRPTQWDPTESNPYTTEGNARLALGLLQKLGIKSAILVGHSQGALTALDMYRQDPASVAAFILVAPALPGTSSDSSWTRRVGFGRQLQLLWTRALLNTDGPGLQYVRRQIRQRAAEIREGGNLGVFADEETSTQDLIDGYLKPMRAHDWDKGSLYSFRTMSFPAKLPYETIAPPVLIVTGEKDRMLTRSAKQVAE
ncbi:hypothetical protein WJX73_004354 [Symbiochloris irregularis]|uniref:AB hydrolase-1 domain-containing protein n=1 Tax=Symbiochloris irregularis TaxID=706552 RepID=A0AAW1NSB2_9CHLO